MAPSVSSSAREADSVKAVGEKWISRVDEVASSTLTDDNGSTESTLRPVPRSWKFMAVALVTAIGFGSQWSSGITGAMKTILKDELGINNTQYALLTGSENFVITALMLLSGLVTDRIGGAGAMLYGSAVVSLGSILVALAAQVRSYKFMIVAKVILAFGDVATHVAQYKVFSSWFAPGDGFAATVGFELMIGKVGAFAGKSTANIIASNTGNFAWVFRICIFMNFVTCILTGVFFWFTRIANRKFLGVRDPATGRVLQEKSKKFEIRKVLELPWSFWCIQAFSMFETSTALIFLNNATELAQQRFNVSAITAGWYTSITQYGGFFIIMLLGIWIDIMGHRIYIMLFCATGVFVSMLLACFANSPAGTAVSFGIFAFAYNFSTTTIVDSIRTSMWHPSVFGSAYALKITINNAMHIIVGIVTGVIQDRDNNSYDNVTIVYVVLSGLSVVVTLILSVLCHNTVDLGLLQWTRKQRAERSDILAECRRRFYGQNGKRNQNISKVCFAACVTLVLGSWCAYFWAIATGNASST